MRSSQDPSPPTAVKLDRAAPTFARNAEIIRQRRAGAAPCKIMRRMGLSRGVVMGVLKRAGLCDANDPRSVNTGRHRSGSKTVPMTEALVRELRARKARGERVLAMAEDLSLNPDNIWRIFRGETWAHVE